ADDRHAALGEGNKRGHAAGGFRLGLADEAGGQEGAAAAQWARVAGAARGEMHAVARARQYGQGGIEIFALVVAVEGIGEKHHFAALRRPDGAYFRSEIIPPPAR